MSIIHEALKKTQEQKESLSVQKAEKGFSRLDNRKKKTSFPKNRKYPAFVLAFSALLISFLAFKPGTAPEKSAEPENSVFSKYMLEGIVYDKDAPFAVINGRAVKRLEKIDEFIVSSISENEVELTEPVEGGKIILSLAF